MALQQPFFVGALKAGILRQVLKALLFRSVVNSPEISVVLVCLIDVVITQEGADVGVFRQDLLVSREKEPGIADKYQRLLLKLFLIKLCCFCVGSFEIFGL